MEAEKGSPEAANQENDAGIVAGGGGDPMGRSDWQGKSCKGCLYYSSILKSNDRNPRCVGFTRTLKHVPKHIIGESEMEATKEGLEVLIDKRTSTADQVATHVHSKEGMRQVNSQRKEHQTVQSAVRSFYSKFHKSAGLVASGVNNNLLRAGRFVKNNFEDILFDRNRPK